MKRAAPCIAAMLLIILMASCGPEGGADTSSSTQMSTVPTQTSVSADNAEPAYTEQPDATGAGEIGSISAGKTGTETTRAKTSAATAAQTTAAAPRDVKVTIPEGYSFMQIADLLQSKGVCAAKAFYDAAQSYRVQSFAVLQSSDVCFKLEGYLFPDTYQFYIGEDPVSALKKMLNGYAAKSGKPSAKTLILASIVEQEARSDENMALVASVFKNRLDAGMKLQSDPTREYVNKYITGNALLGDTSRYAALYNTYKCPALPAGPICSPGKRAIAAAANPAQSDYLYFFFGNDNQNHYAKTSAEFERQKQEFGVQFN